MKPDARPLAVGLVGRGLVDPDEPVIHADDAGLLRGLAAFETLRVYDGRPFAMAEHLDRLSRSLARLQLPTPDLAALEAIAREAIEAAGVADCALRFTVTAGRSGEDAPVAMATVLALPADLEDVRRRGVSAVALQLGIDPQRRGEAPWLLGGVKSTSYAVNMAAWDEARRRGADEALFVATDRTVLEGPVANVWWRRGSVLRTPSLDLGILAGVTRACVTRLAPDSGFSVEEGWFPLDDLASAEEAFSSSSVRELMPIVMLDGIPIGTGTPGHAAKRLQAALRAAAGA